MFHSIAVVFRVACITGLFLSLTLNGFVIDDGPPPSRPASKSSYKPPFYEYYPDHDGGLRDDAGVVFEYPQRGVESKRYLRGDRLEESEREGFEDIFNDKDGLNVLERGGFKDEFDRNEYFKDILNENDFSKEIDNVYRNLIEKNNLLKSKNGVKGIENSYKMETKLTEDGLNGVRGVARVDGQVVQSTYNGSQPVVKVAKVHASATKDSNDADWKVQPIESEYEIATPSLQKDEKKKKKDGEEEEEEENYGKSGQDELEQLMLGDDYEVGAIDEYIKTQLNQNKFAFNNKISSKRDKTSQKEEGSRTSHSSSLVRKKRMVTMDQPQREASKAKEVDDVALLKRYIALQDAENHSLMRALDLASEIEFEQDEKVGDKAKQGKLLEEQMRLMKKALANEKTLGEIKKVFEENLKAGKAAKKKKPAPKQQNTPAHDKWQQMNSGYENENASSDDLPARYQLPTYFVRHSAPQPYRNNYLQAESTANAEMNERDARNMEYLKGGFGDYEGEGGMGREEYVAKQIKKSDPRLSHRPQEPQLTDAEKAMMDEFVMRKVREYVRGGMDGGVAQSSRGKSHNSDDYYYEADEVGGGAEGDYESYPTEPMPEYPVYPLIKYKRNKEPWCREAEGLVNDCRLPRQRGLILDADAIHLCNMHTLCLQCGSVQGFSENDCHNMYYDTARWYCREQKSCLNQAQVLFLNMLNGSTYRVNSALLCHHPCVGGVLRAGLA